MKSIKKLEENSIYLLSGKAVAKNAFFETRKDVEFAHRYIMRYLQGMMDIQDYLFTPDGWMLIVKTKSAESISESYSIFRQNSKKAKEGSIKTNPSDMLSEHIRFYLSALVKSMNKENIRTGTKVHRVFERFIFESYEECIGYMESMHAEVLELCSQREKYQSVLLDYKELYKIVGKGNVILCSKGGVSEEVIRNSSGITIDLQRLTKDFLRNLTRSTISRHINHFKTYSNPNSS